LHVYFLYSLVCIVCSFCLLFVLSLADEIKIYINTVGYLKFLAKHKYYKDVLIVALVSL